MLVLPNLIPLAPKEAQANQNVNSFANASRPRSVSSLKDVLRQSLKELITSCASRQHTSPKN